MTFFEALCEELEFRALNARSKEAREALQSVKHAIEDVIKRDGAPPMDWAWLRALTLHTKQNIVGRGGGTQPLIRSSEGDPSVTPDCSRPDLTHAADLAAKEGK